MTFAVDSGCVDRVEPAVNFGNRVFADDGPQSPDILLLHYTGMADSQQALSWLCCEESGVSCHYLVFEDGETIQMVPENLRAHHAGAGSWEGHGDVNSRSIGIEIANSGHPGGLPPFPEAQMQAVLRLSLDIIARNPIVSHRVLGHSDIAPGRKIDPGENFDWKWMHQRGVGHWIPSPPVGSGRFLQRGDRGEPVEALQSMLSIYGYGIEITGEFDEKTHSVVEAFQRHFRQEKVDGVADVSTIETLHGLIVSRPSSMTEQLS